MPNPSAASVERPPIVAVLGHVDHGKSTLLDFIRKSNVVAGEAGGITQHVAAYEVVHKAKRITFIDTPGHAAFSAIRSRGASVADIAILVVAADDGVKAQTLEALKSIRDAGTPFIVAINKIDKPNANIERTQATLAEQGVYLEKLGGDVPWSAVSAKNGTGVEELLDLILLVAEVEEFSGDPTRAARGYVLEAHRDQKRGLAATLVITEGTLRSGMAVLAGRGIAPVRIMEDHTGATLKEASFSTPVTLVGFDEMPEAGAEFSSFKNKREAELGRPAAARASQTRTETSDDETGPFMMPLIIRADVSGSLEAISHELAVLGDEHKRIQIVQTGIGNISENDVNTALAGAVPATVIGFNVTVDPIAEALARERGVRIELFTVIYKLSERAQEILDQTAPKRLVEEIVGRAKVLKHFSSRKDEQVVGAKVLTGYLARKSHVRVMRREANLGAGKIKNIQSNKQDVERIESDREFGAQIEVPFDIMPGDTLECIVQAMK